MAVATAIALAVPPPAIAQPKPVATTPESEASAFNVEQLDAMLAPIALYPDELLTQTLMASSYPLQVVAAARWLEKDNNKSLKGDALVKALEKENWDPSVKSLVPFPQVLTMLNDNLEWTEQLGYAMATQQAAVLDSIQRLRRQAQKAGSLKTTEQQKVVVEKETLIIEPSSPETVYVPVYRPANVYGEWPYPSYPPVYIPPPQAYYPAAYAPGYVWGAGLAFATGVAVAGGLWGWARPGWGYGNVTVNPLRYNSINVNRTAIRSNTWQPPAAGVGGRPIRPPGGPVGAPARPSTLPTNAIGRGSVQVPRSAVNRPQIPAAGAGAGQRPGGAPARPPQVAQRPSAGQLPAGGQRPGAGAGLGQQRPIPGQLPSGGPGARGGYAGAAQRPAGAFGGMGDGARASQFSARGAQSMGSYQNTMARAGGGFQGGGARAGGGGGSRLME
jgi:hypothetical protein